MMKLQGKIRLVAGIGSLLFISLMLIPGCVLATTVSGNNSSVTINDPPSGVISVRIAGPEGVITTSEGLTVFSKGGFTDGDYQYELIGKLLAQKKGKSKLEANGRGEVKLVAPVGVIETGDFRIINGKVADTRVLNEKE